MGTDQWNHGKFVQHKVRNGSRRGYLQKTYGDKKLLHTRIKTGDKNINDKIEHVQPAGFLGRHPPGEKCEVFTNDVGGDTSHRVSTVIGDREHHPKIDEAESILYSPGDKKNYMRIKGTKQKQEGQGKHGSGAEFEDPFDGFDSNGKAEETDKNPKGIHAATEDDETHTVKGTAQIHADKDVRIKSKKIHFKGDIHLDGNLYVKAGFKPGGGPWLDGKPDDYPGSKQTTRDPPPPETEPWPVATSRTPPGYLVDGEGNMTFTGRVTFRGPVQFDGPVQFESTVGFSERDDK